MIENLIVENIKSSSLENNNLGSKIDKELENQIENKEYAIDSLQSKLDDITNLKSELNSKIDDINFDEQICNNELMFLENIEIILNKFIDILQSIGFDIDTIRLDSIQELHQEIVEFDSSKLLLKNKLSQNEIQFLQIQEKLSDVIYNKESLIQVKELFDSKYKNILENIENYAKQKNLSTEDIEALNNFTKNIISELESYNIKTDDINTFSLQFSKNLVEEIDRFKNELDDFDIDFNKVLQSAQEEAIMGGAFGVVGGPAGVFMGIVYGGSSGIISEILKEYAKSEGISEGVSDYLQAGVKMLTPMGIEKMGLKLLNTKLGETVLKSLDDIKIYAGDKVKTLEYETKGIFNDLRTYDFVDKDGNIIFTGKIKDIVGDRTIKMDYVGSDMKNSNAVGFERNSQKFGKLYMEKYPETLSEMNQKLIEAGKAPIVDKQWIKYHPEQKPFLGEKLEHHHLNNTNEAVYIPQTLHRGKVNKENMHVA